MNRNERRAAEARDKKQREASLREAAEPALDLVAKHLRGHPSAADGGIRVEWSPDGQWRLFTLPREELLDLVERGSPPVPGLAASIRAVGTERTPVLVLLRKVDGEFIAANAVASRREDGSFAVKLET
jgi:hypothetical protein